MLWISPYKKLEDRITDPNTPVNDSPAKPKTSSSHRRKSSGKETKQNSKTKHKKNEKEASKSKEVPNGKTKVTVTDSSAKVIDGGVNLKVRGLTGT